MQGFSNTTVVVTGGGTGLGLATARCLALGGARVVVAGRRASPLSEAVRMLADEGGEAMSVECDVSKPEDVERLFDATRNHFGPADRLVNNAGGQFPSKALDISPNGWRAVLETNLSGTFYCCQQFAKQQMLGGCIVNVTIPWAIKAVPGMSHAIAARAGVIALTKSLALEWADMGIRVNAIAPGIIPTQGMIEEELHGDTSGIEGFLSAVPAKRFATTQEVAEVIAFMLSDSTSYMTGHTLVFDGGAVLGTGIDFSATSTDPTG